MRFKLGSSLKALLEWRETSQADLTLSTAVAEIEEACSWLSAQLDDASLSWTELIALTAGLEPIGRQLRRVLKVSRARDGEGRATRLLEDALQQIYACLYSIQPFRPYLWPNTLRARLRHALQSIRYALVAVRWAEIQVTDAAS